MTENDKYPNLEMFTPAELRRMSHRDWEIKALGGDTRDRQQTENKTMETTIKTKDDHGEGTRFRVAELQGTIYEVLRAVPDPRQEEYWTRAVDPKDGVSDWAYSGDYIRANPVKRLEDFDFEGMKLEYVRANMAKFAAADALADKTNELELAIKALKDQFALDNKEMIDVATAAGLRFQAADDELRDYAKLYYAEKKEKTVDPYLGVKVTESMTIKDAAAAAEWAKSNAPVLLVIDEKAFKTFAKGKEYDFTETKETVSAVVQIQKLAKDYSGLAGMDSIK